MTLWILCSNTSFAILTGESNITVAIVGIYQIQAFATVHARIWIAFIKLSLTIDTGVSGLTWLFGFIQKQRVPQIANRWQSHKSRAYRDMCQIERYRRRTCTHIWMPGRDALWWHKHQHHRSWDNFRSVLELEHIWKEYMIRKKKWKKKFFLMISTLAWYACFKLISGFVAFARIFECWIGMRGYYAYTCSTVFATAWWLGFRNNAFKKNKINRKIL